MTPTDLLAGARSDLSALAAKLQHACGHALKAVRAAKLFEQEVRAAAADNRISAEDFANLEKCAKDLGLADDAKASIYTSILIETINTHLDELISNGALSPEEDADLTDFLANLNVKVTLDEGTIARINEARRAWQVSFGPLPVITSPVLLQRNEVAHAHANATAYVERTRTVRIKSAGFTTRVKFLRTLYYRSSNLKVAKETKEYQQCLGGGNLVVTNKRLIFAGGNRASSLRLDSIIGLEPYRDGVRVQRANGKLVTYAFSEEDPWFGAILQRARADAAGTTSEPQ